MQEECERRKQEEIEMIIEKITQEILNKKECQNCVEKKKLLQQREKELE